MLQQVPIEEILEEFRKKYGNDNTVKESSPPPIEHERNYIAPVNIPESVPENFPKYIPENNRGTNPFEGREFMPQFVQTKKSDRNSLSLARIVSIQGIVAAVIAGLLIVIKLSNPELYQYIVQALQVRL